MQIKITLDGSSTLYNDELDETYHSLHGAIQEALHVFIASGLNYFTTNTQLSILEVGFGTGLNTLLTVLHCNEKLVKYTALETYPIPKEIVSELNYVNLLQEKNAEQIFKKIHACDWEKNDTKIENFSLTKLNKKVQDICFEQEFDVVYYDAFGPKAQPEMWTIEIFEKLYKSIKPSGILVTYCAKGEVKRMLKAVGFIVETLPGPPGKREMTRAIKAN